ncbi:MAG: hypothetical protein COA43_09845 [Robiginitomaculum sp.]|nr:MAG: hypothetical protein COA43_09845 [Robiginitomaculum sp.]
MDKLVTIRKWWIRISAGLAVFTPLFMAVSALGARFGLWSWQFSFGKLVLDYGFKLLILTLVLSVLAIVFSFVMKPRARKNIIVSVLALSVPLIGIGYGKSIKAKNASLPSIHDITTDTENVPTFSSAIVNLRGEKSNSLDYVGKIERHSEKLVSVLQVEAYPDIRTLVLSDTPEVIYARVQNAVKSMGWKTVTDSADTGVIEATATSFWFGFKDDVIVRVRAAQGGGSRVDIRSVSRVGRSDMGANAARIRKFRKILGQ